MSRFFVKPEAVEDRDIYLTDKQALHHMKKVLRMSEGDEMDISDGSAWEYHVEIESLDDKEAEICKRARTSCDSLSGDSKG